MARGLIANVVSDMDGIILPTPTTGNATDNHYFNNTGRTKVFIKNTGASARIATVHVSRTVAGQTPAPITKSIPAGETHVFGPYAINDFGRTVNVDVAHAELTLYSVD